MNIKKKICLFIALVLLMGAVPFELFAKAADKYSYLFEPSSVFEEVYYKLSNEYYIVRNKTSKVDESGYTIYQMGVCDSKGNVVVKVENDDVVGYSNSHFIVSKSEKTAFIDIKTKEITYKDYVCEGTGSAGRVVNTDSIMKVYKKDKNGEKLYGFVDYKGKIIIEPQYESADFFYDGRARIWEGSKELYIDKNNNIMNETNAEKEQKLIKVLKNGKWGYTDKSGKVIIPFEYEEFFGNLSYFDEDMQFIAAKKDGKMGYINANNKIIVPFEYEEFIECTSYSDEKTVIILAKKADKWGYINTNNKIIIPFEYEDVEYTVHGLLFLKKDGKVGYIEDFKIIIPFEYESISRLSEEIFVARKDDKWGYIDKNNKIIVPFEYEMIDTTLEREGSFVGKKAGKMGYVENFNTIIPFEYEDITHLLSGKFVAKKAGKWGSINKYNETIISFEYENIGEFSENGYVSVKKNGKYGCINEENEILIPFKYDSIGDFKDGFAKVTLKGKKGYIDEEGIFFDYARTKTFTKNSFGASIDGKGTVVINNNK